MFELDNLCACYIKTLLALEIRVSVFCCRKNYLLALLGTAIVQFSVASHKARASQLARCTYSA